jgi:hypothetical protein
MQKDIPGKGGVGLDVWCGHKTRRIVYLDRMSFPDDATAKFDRGNMTLADSPKSQDEAQIFWPEMCLVRMLNN